MAPDNLGKNPLTYPGSFFLAIRQSVLPKRVFESTLSQQLIRIDMLWRPIGLDRQNALRGDRRFAVGYRAQTQLLIGVANDLARRAYPAVIARMAVVYDILAIRPNRDPDQPRGQHDDEDAVDAQHQTVFCFQWLSFGTESGQPVKKRNP